MGKKNHKIKALASLVVDHKDLPESLRRRALAVVEAGSVAAYADSLEISRQAAYLQVDRLLAWRPPAQRIPKPKGLHAVVPPKAQHCQTTRCFYLVRLLGNPRIRNKGATLKELAGLFSVSENCIKRDMELLQGFLPVWVDGDRWHLDQVVQLPINDFRVTYRA